MELSNPATVIIRSKQRQSERLSSCDGLTEGLDTVERWSQRRVADALLELCVAAGCNQREQHCSALQYGMHNIAFSVGFCTW